MFKIEDGREHFYQWDLNRKLIVQDASIKEVHFCNRTDTCSYVVEVIEGLANVPNILLQDNFKIKVYGYDGEATMHSATFVVNTRSKPENYVYTETEIKRWEALEERVIEAVDASGYYIPSISADGYLNFDASKEAMPQAPAPVYIKGEKGDKGDNGDGVVEITEETFIADLATGVYAVKSTDDSYCLWLDDAYWWGVCEGTVIVSRSELDKVFSWTYNGRDTNGVNTMATGMTFWYEDEGYWLCEDWQDLFNEVESSTNKRNDLREPDTETYPTTQAVVDYVEDKTAPKVFEKIATYKVAPDADGKLPSKIIINKDMNGLAFELTDIYCDMVMGLTDGSAGRFYITAAGVGSLIGNGSSWGFTDVLRRWSIRVDSFGGKAGGIITAPGATTIQGGSYPNANMSTMCGQPIPPGKEVVMKDLQIVASVGTAKTFVEGSTVTLWGVRK